MKSLECLYLPDNEGGPSDIFLPAPTGAPCPVNLSGLQPFKAQYWRWGLRVIVSLLQALTLTDTRLQLLLDGIIQMLGLSCFPTFFLHKGATEKKQLF